jgi:prepilin-type N-terminal cleavage/methylation domain-containing protein
MVRRRTTDVRRHEAGFSLTELIVVIAMIGIVAVLAGPQFMSYWRTSATSAAATELATAVNRARQLAIAGNQPVCAEVDSSRLKYRVNSNAACTGGAIWTGSGTDAAGRVTISNNMSVSGGPVVFSQLGAATLAGTFTVTNPNGGSRNVVVAGSGRVSVQ